MSPCPDSNDAGRAFFPGRDRLSGSIQLLIAFPQRIMNSVERRLPGLAGIAQHLFPQPGGFLVQLILLAALSAKQTGFGIVSRSGIVDSGQDFAGLTGLMALKK